MFKSKLFSGIQSPAIRKPIIALYALMVFILPFNIYIAFQTFRMGYPANMLQPVPTGKGVLNQAEVINMLFDNRYGKLSFDYYAIKHPILGGYTKGYTSCGEQSYLYTYVNENAWIPGYSKGIWVEVTECGMEAEKLFEEIGYQTGNKSAARIYMPLAALENVKTFEDYEAAIKNYGVLYEVNQPLLAAVLQIDVRRLPLNNQLSKP